LLKARAAAATVAAAVGEATPLQAQLAALKAQGHDPDAANRQRLEQARGQLAAANQRLASFEAGMVPPQKMQGFLEGLLASNRNLQLLSLKTLPVTPALAAGEKRPEAVVEAAAAEAVPPAAAVSAAASLSGEGIYLHGVEIELAGSYNDLLTYLTELERMPQRVMWSRVELKVDQYPRNVLTLRIYTLSLDRKWLVV